MEKINNTKEVAAFVASGGRIRHARYDRITFAFRKKKGRLVEVAFANCNPSDDFVKKLGTKLALERFNEGNTVLLPVVLLSAMLREAA